MLAPSPKISSGSTITSPRLTPIRKRMRFSWGVSALQSITARWELDGTADGIHNAVKRDQHAVAGILYDAPAVLLELRIDHLAENPLEPFVRPLLVHSHLPAISRDIDGENGGQHLAGKYRQRRR